MPARIVTQRELNRTHLHRQSLLQRSAMGVGDMLSAIVGLQGQVTKDPYLALWSRIEAFTHDDLTSMLESRTAVRASLMRGTIHVVTAEDYLMIVPVTQTHHRKAFPQTDSCKQVPAEIVPDVLTRSRELLSGNPMSSRQITAELTKEWPDVLPRGLGQTSRFLLALIQVTPRGIWGKGGVPTWSLASEWLGVEIADAVGPTDELIRRYLRAFGPASLADITSWSGVTNLKQTVIALGDELVTYRNEAGTVLYDLAGMEITPADTPAPVRFLPGFDNALLGHKDRSRIISDEYRRIIGTPNGMFASTFLVDGFVAGIWRVHDGALELAEFAPLSSPQKREVEREAAMLAPFWTGEELPIRWADLWKLPGKH